MNPLEIVSELDSVIRIAESAGQAIVQVYESRSLETRLKADQTPVTLADKAAQDLILASLSSLPSQLPVVSEEAESIEYETRISWPAFWLVDPLDGTKEFIAGYREFTVNIALIVSGEPILGIVHAPALQQTYYGTKGGRAFRKTKEGSHEAIAVRHKSSDEPLRVVASRLHRSPALERFLSELRDVETFSAGSALKFCWIAEGRADLYPRFGATMEWDTAAGQCVVEAAGGCVTDLRGEQLRYNKPNLRSPSFLAMARFSEPVQSAAQRSGEELTQD